VNSRAAYAATVEMPLRIEMPLWVLFMWHSSCRRPLKGQVARFLGIEA
jgi:hypothetical protein